MTITLYIKQHRDTGLKYFGKTIRDPQRYQGSGRYWRNHIRAHGENIETVWTMAFEDQTLCSEFAELFSELYDIVQDPAWANQIPENGLGGVPKGRPNTWTQKGWHHSDETRAKIRASRAVQTARGINGMKGRRQSDETKKLLSKQRIGKKLAPWTPERRARVAETWARKKLLNNT